MSQTVVEEDVAEAAQGIQDIHVSGQPGETQLGDQPASEQPSSTCSKQLQVQICSWNILGQGGKKVTDYRKKVVQETFKKFNTADIIFLQEIPESDCGAYLPTLSVDDQQYFVVGTSKSNNYTAICFNSSKFQYQKTWWQDLAKKAESLMTYKRKCYEFVEKRGDSAFPVDSSQLKQDITAAGPGELEDSKLKVVVEVLEESKKKMYEAVTRATSRSCARLRQIDVLEERMAVSVLKVIKFNTDFYIIAISFHNSSKSDARDFVCLLFDFLEKVRLCFAHRKHAVVIGGDFNYDLSKCETDEILKGLTKLEEYKPIPHYDLTPLRDYKHEGAGRPPTGKIDYIIASQSEGFKITFDQVRAQSLSIPDELKKYYMVREKEEWKDDYAKQRTLCNHNPLSTLLTITTK